MRRPLLDPDRARRAWIAVGYAALAVAAFCAFVGMISLALALGDIHPAYGIVAGTIEVLIVIWFAFYFSEEDE